MKRRSVKRTCVETEKFFDSGKNRNVRKDPALRNVRIFFYRKNKDIVRCISPIPKEYFDQQKDDDFYKRA